MILKRFQRSITSMSTLDIYISFIYTVSISLLVSVSKCNSSKFFLLIKTLVSRHSIQTDFSIYFLFILLCICLLLISGASSIDFLMALLSISTRFLWIPQAPLFQLCLLNYSRDIRVFPICLWQYSNFSHLCALYNFNPKNTSSSSCISEFSLNFLEPSVLFSIYFSTVFINLGLSSPLLLTFLVVPVSFYLI